MYLSARARLIMEQLLISNRPVDVKELAEDLNVSERSIRRDLKEVKATLKSYQLALLKDHGYLTLEGSERDKQNFRWYLMDLSYSDYSPEERQQKILKALLKEEDGLKLVGLANDLKVTVSTISNDLTKIEEWLPATVVIEKKRGFGVSLQADEAHKRSLMSELFTQQFPHYQLLKYFQEKARTETTNEWVEERLLHLISEPLLEKVEGIVRSWRAKNANEISDEAYANLVVHISISVERMIAGNFIQDGPNQEKMEQYPEFTAAMQLLADSLDMEPDYVPKGEVSYVTAHLRGAKIRENSQLLFENEELQIMTLTKKLIALVEQKLDQKLPKEPLAKGLEAHLRPTLRRLQQEMRIYNPLIQSIKQDYADLFKVVREAFDEVYQGVHAPDEEIGYLVLHFGAVLIQLENDNRFSGLVVCASGIGTSRMLVTRLHQRIPQLKKLETVSLFELPKKRAESHFDVIISTIDLGKVAFDYFLVSPILNERELSQIEFFLKSLHGDYHKKIADEKQAEQLNLLEAIHFLEQKQLFSQMILTIFKNFNYARLDANLGTIEDTIRAMCTQLLEKDPELEVEGLISTLLQEDDWKIFGIPEARIGMFHTRNNAIKEPFFQLFSLEKPLLIKNMDQSKMMIDQIVLLLVPEKFSQEGLEIISYISTLFVDNRELRTILTEGVGEKIATYFVGKLLSYLETRRKIE